MLAQTRTLPQARLPDINTAFNTHRKRAILAIESQNWTEAIGALYAINASLPLEYRVIISNEKYNELTKQDLVAECNNCKERIDYSRIRVLTVIVSPTVQLLTNQHTERIWVCPLCKKDNRLIETKVEQSILAQPYYLGVISKPPKRTDSLVSHINYDRTMERWCWTMLDELEQKMAQYRDDNWSRDDELEEFGAPIDTKWEDSDGNNG